MSYKSKNYQMDINKQLVQRHPLCHTQFVEWSFERHTRDSDMAGIRYDINHQPGDWFDDRNEAAGLATWTWKLLLPCEQRLTDMEKYGPGPRLFKKGMRMPLIVFLGEQDDERRTCAENNESEPAAKRGCNSARINTIQCQEHWKKAECGLTDVLRLRGNGPPGLEHLKKAECGLTDVLRLRGNGPPGLERGVHYDWHGPRGCGSGVHGGGKLQCCYCQYVHGCGTLWLASCGDVETAAWFTKSTRSLDIGPLGHGKYVHDWHCHEWDGNHWRYDTCYSPFVWWQSHPDCDLVPIPFVWWEPYHYPLMIEPEVAGE